MLLPILMLASALLLIYLEFYLPGGIMGTAGALMLIASIIFFIVQSNSLAITVLFIVTATVLVGALIKVTLWQIHNSKHSSAIYSDGDQEGYQASSFEGNAIGKRGEALTPLRPSGHIKVEGKRYQAVSRFGFVAKGTLVEVMEGEGGRLIVRAVKDPKS